MTYKLSQKADHDLFSLYLEGIEEHGVLQADIYYDELVGALNLLACQPSRDGKGSLRVRPGCSGASTQGAHHHL